jgi:hypothetical protein
VFLDDIREILVARDVDVGLNIRHASGGLLYAAIIPA